jgi:nitrate/TMAO reductase-like tetraheme cytochrome c subunit
MHKMVLEKKGTCIDCHKGIAHKEPEEPAQPAKTSALR